MPVTPLVNLIGLWRCNIVQPAPPWPSSEGRTDAVTMTGHGAVRPQRDPGMSTPGPTSDGILGHRQEAAGRPVVLFVTIDQASTLAAAELAA